MDCVSLRLQSQTVLRLPTFWKLFECSHQAYDVILTSMRRLDVASFSVRLHFDVMCPLSSKYFPNSSYVHNLSFHSNNISVSLEGDISKRGQTVEHRIAGDLIPMIPPAGNEICSCLKHLTKRKITYKHVSTIFCRTDSTRRIETKHTLEIYHINHQLNTSFQLVFVCN